MGSVRSRVVLIAIGCVIVPAVATGGDDFGMFMDEQMDAKTAQQLGTESTEGLFEVLNTPGMSTTDEDKAGGEFNVMMTLDRPCMTEAIAVRTEMVGAAQAKRDIANWQAKLDKKNMTEYEFWKEVMHCKDYCARILVDAMDCYTNSAASRYRGIFLFDTGIGHYQGRTRGDRASGHKTHNNEPLMKQLVAMMRARPGAHIMLEGRASPVGNDEANFRLSGHRADSIKREFEGRGIGSGRIHYRWIGEGEPSYRGWLARKYQVMDKFDTFGQQTMNQSVTVYVFTPKG